MDDGKRSFEVSVTTIVNASVDEDAVSGSLPKLIQRWPSELFDALRRQWMEQTGLPVEQFDEADMVEIRECDPSGFPIS